MLKRCGTYTVAPTEYTASRAAPTMPNGSRSWRPIRLALSTQPLQTRKTADSGAASSVARELEAAVPSTAWRTPLRAAYTGSPPIQSSPLNVLRTLSGLELPGLLEQPLHGAGEAQDRDHEEEEPDDAKAGARARGRREDVLDRLGAASGQVVTLDDALGRALAAEFDATALVTISSGIVAVSAPEARAIERSNPASF